jgi:NADH-quinone oxidoreductase subunit L
MSSFVPSIWVIVLPFLGAALVAVLGIRHERLVPGVSVAIGAVNAIVALLMVPRISGGKAFFYRWLPGISDFSVVADGIGAFIALAAAVLGVLILTYSLRYMEHEESKTRYYALVLVFIGAMSGLVLSGSLLTMYFFWEICGICSFSLIGFHYEDPKALKGAIKAFITTKLGDVGLLSGILVLYFGSAPHTFDMAAIIERAMSGAIPAQVLAFSAFAMLVGAMGKSAQIPSMSGCRTRWRPRLRSRP